jgi:ATPases involved in chromosome partitioning
MKVISLINQKGGVGKTTSAVNISDILGSMNYKVLLIDLDPQGNTTSTSKVDKKSIEYTTKDLLLDKDIYIKDIKIECEMYDLIPSNLGVAKTDLGLMQQMRNEEKLSKKLIGIDYDYVIIDCPPSLALSTINGMIASDLILMPLELEEYSLEGIETLLETIEFVKEVKEDLEYNFLITKYDKRIKMFVENKDLMYEKLGYLTLDTHIRIDNTVRKAQKEKKTLREYNTNSNVYKDYLALVEEIK